MFRIVLKTILYCSCLLLCACGQRVELGAPYVGLLRQLSNPDRIATLSGPGTVVGASYDRTGGNDDFGYYLRKEDNWLVIADIKEPGVLTRFWTTGIKNDQRFQFFFDGERKPRMDITLGEMRSGKAPFVECLARYEQSCFYSFAPIPFNKSLKIRTIDTWAASPQRKFYWQYNWLPLAEAPASWPRKPNADVLDALEQFGRVFEAPAPVVGESVRSEQTILPGSDVVLAEQTGPAVIRELRLTPETFHPEFLRGIVLKIYWDDSAEPSVAVPLGDFFGSVWNRTRYQSRFFGIEGDTFICRFPMPFEKSARITIANESKSTVRLKTEVQVSNDWKNGLGYFHAIWNKSGSAPGKPHPILRTEGRGKYVGCILSATSFDRSWWLLESDETMIRDNETKPCWHGTGLEDYFNSGWYYKNVIARPLHGLVFKAPYRTVQYRLHDLDAVHFDKKMAVMMERGPGNASHGTFESTAFYYLKEPTAVTLAADRTPPKDPHARYTLMSELANLERLGDYAGASEAIDQWLAENSSPAAEPILRLRQIAYIERLQGIETAKPLYKKFVAETSSAVAKQLAEQLLWFHESPNHALLSLYSKNPSRLSLNGKPMLTGGNPQRMVVKKVVLESGQNELTLETQKMGYPDWVQACLRTHKGLIATGPDWEFTFDNAQWYFVRGTFREGPPAAPHVAMDAHPFVDMHSKARAIWTSEKWPANVSRVLFRKKFTHP